MNNRFVKRMVSVLLVLVMLISMLSVSFVTSSAKDTQQQVGMGFFATAAAEKMLELGLRTACGITLKLGETADGEVNKAVESFSKWFLMDAAETAAYETKQLCEEILKELAVIEEKITDYTTEISSQIAGSTAAKKKELHNTRWSEDVTGIIDKNGMTDVYNRYCEYFIIANLKEMGLPEDESYMEALNSIWEGLTGKSKITEADITEEAYITAENEFKKALFAMYNVNAKPDSESAQAAVYGSTTVNDVFAKTISELCSKFVVKGGGSIDSQQSCVETAATYAFFALPYAHQQYDYINSMANKQVMVVMMLEMANNEFLNYQGEYLADDSNWAEKENINSGNLNISYKQLKESYVEQANNVAEQATLMFDSNITVDIEAYNSTQKTFTTKLSSYMTPQDAVPVDLTLNNYKESVDYTSELNKNNSNTAVINDSQKSNKIYTNKVMRFNRVMVGGTSGEVYYILDPTQFSDSSANEIGIVDHNINRKSDVIDLYGNIHVTSCDYRNLISSMSDGANTYSCPNSSEVYNGKGGVLSNLFDTPTFAFSGFIPETFLSPYVPAKKSGESYILTSTYHHDYSGGAIYTKYADMDLIKASQGDNNSTISVGNYSFENLKFNNGGHDHSYALVLDNKNNVDIYMQSANVSKVDAGNTIEDFYLVNNGDVFTNEITSIESTMAANSATAKIKAGNNIALRFKLSKDSTFVSLKCVRNNVSATETVLVNSFDELSTFEKTDDGYYEFNYHMPYSNATFVLETKEYVPDLQKDDNGNYVIGTYDDLYTMYEAVNGGYSGFVDASYVVTNDIVVPDGEQWTTPIGDAFSPFKGTFDGQGYTISGLNTSGEEQINCYGLFGIIQNATVKNVNLADIDYYADAYSVGAVCGEAYTSTISNCTAGGKISSVYPYSDIGGIVGFSYGSTIEKCINRCEVDTDGSEIGGICGTNEGTILNCANYASIKGSENAYNVSGIAGRSSGDVSDCFNVGSISTDGGETYNIASDCVDNCYYLDTAKAGDDGTAKSIDAFNSGEVTYLLNEGIVHGVQVWYQNVDYAQPYDEYPVFDKNENNIVFKVNRGDKHYSNTLIDFIYGDVDFDGEVTIFDATIIQRYLAKYFDLPISAKLAAEVNSDGVINISDVSTIQRYLAKYVDELPIK